MMVFARRMLLLGIILKTISPGVFAGTVDPFHIRVDSIQLKFESEAGLSRSLLNFLKDSPDHTYLMQVSYLSFVYHICEAAKCLLEKSANMDFDKRVEIPKAKTPLRVCDFVMDRSRKMLTLADKGVGCQGLIPQHQWNLSKLLSTRILTPPTNQVSRYNRIIDICLLLSLGAIPSEEAKMKLQEDSLLWNIYETAESWGLHNIEHNAPLFSNQPVYLSESFMNTEGAYPPLSSPTLENFPDANSNIQPTFGTSPHKDGRQNSKSQNNSSAGPTDRPNFTPNFGEIIDNPQDIENIGQPNKGNRPWNASANKPSMTGGSQQQPLLAPAPTDNIAYENNPTPTNDALFPTVEPIAGNPGLQQNIASLQAETPGGRQPLYGNQDGYPSGLSSQNPYDMTGGPTEDPSSGDRFQLQTQPTGQQNLYGTPSVQGNLDGPQAGYLGSTDHSYGMTGEPTSAPSSGDRFQLQTQPTGQQNLYGTPSVQGSQQNAYGMPGAQGNLDGPQAGYLGSTDHSYGMTGAQTSVPSSGDRFPLQTQPSSQQSPYGMLGNQNPYGSQQTPYGAQAGYPEGMTSPSSYSMTGSSTSDPTSGDRFQLQLPPNSQQTQGGAQQNPNGTNGASSSYGPPNIQGPAGNTSLEPNPYASLTINGYPVQFSNMNVNVTQ